MKLPIKKKYFDQIKYGSKWFEYRDAHITFVCEETGEQLRKEVDGVDLVDKPNEYKDVLEDKIVIRFGLVHDNHQRSKR